MAKSRDKDLKITDDYININTEKKEDNNEHTQIKYNIDESELEIINKENENFSEKEENLESSDSENIEDIKDDFIDTNNISDKYNQNNKKINSKYNEYTDLYGNLNNKNNSFIKQMIH